MQPLTVTVNVEGSTFKEDFTDLEGATYTCSTGDHRTAADAVMAALTKNQYTYTGSSTYLSGITDPNSVSLTGGDSAFGSWSGWMFTVNGEMPIEHYDNGQPIYATLGTYQLKDGDVVRMYYVACPTESGQHTWDDGQVTKAATCTENGVMTYTCTMCSDTKTEVIPATGHDWGQPVWSWNGTESASAVFTCGNDASHTQTLPAAVTSQVTTQPGCESTGVRTYTAAVTFEGQTYTDTKTEALPATGHDTEIVGAKAATCTQDGYTGDEVCKTCGGTVKKGEVIPATGHDTQVVGAKSATCTQDGYTGDEVCKTCGVTVKQGEVLPALGHDYKDGKCSRCGAEEPTTPVEPGKPGDSGKPTTPEKPDEPSQPTTPATGDSSTLVLWVSGMLVCALGAGLMLRRKKEN